MSPELACTPDVSDSLANLGDAIPFVEKLSFLWNGGAVFSASIDGKLKAALKVGKTAVPVYNVSSQFLNEYTFSKISQSLDMCMGRRTTRSMVVPFAPAPPRPTVCSRQFRRQCMPCHSFKEQSSQQTECLLSHLGIACSKRYT